MSRSIQLKCMNETIMTCMILFKKEALSLISYMIRDNLVQQIYDQYGVNIYMIKLYNKDSFYF
jgi:hypothetical protein